MLARVGGLTLLTCACAFDGFLLQLLLVSACPLLRLDNVALEVITGVAFAFGLTSSVLQSQRDCSI